MALARGYDVSDYQSSIPPDADFVFVKASEGAHTEQTGYAAKVADARARGIVVGHYHFIHCENAVDDEVAHFLSVVGDVPAGELLALDFEPYGQNVPDATATAQKNAWLAAVKAAHPDRLVGLYADLDYWHRTDEDCGDFLWIADYGDPAGSPAVQHPWKFHQFTDQPLDTNVYDGTVDDLRAWAGTAAPAASPAPQWRTLLDHVLAVPEQIYETWVSGEGWNNITQFGAEYGENGVSWCFAAGTQIATPDGNRPIEDIEIGDKVSSATGKASHVLAVNSRSAPTVRITGYGFESVTTAEHPYYGRRLTHPPRRNPHVRRYELQARETEEPDWIPAGELRRGDFVGIPVPVTGNDRVNEHRAYVHGRFLADGHRDQRRGGGVHICCAPREADYLRARVEGSGYAFSESVHRTVIQFNLVGRDVWEEFCPYGYRSHGKTVPGFVYEWEYTGRRSFMEGYFDGDGTVAGTQWSAQSTSRRLAYGVADILRSIDRPAIVRRYEKPATAVIEGRTVNQRTEVWQVGYCTNRKHPQWFREGDYFWVPVRTVIPDRERTVYNMTVENEHTFVADGVAVHNCVEFDWDMFHDVGLDAIVPKTDNVSAFATWAKANGQWSEYPSVGAWVDFGDGAHTEIVTGFDADTVYTKGGNSVQAGATDNGQGNGVWSHTHARRDAYVTGYFAPRFPDGVCPPTADPADPRGGAEVTSWLPNTPTPPIDPNAFPGASMFGPGARNDYVTRLGQMLVARGGGRFYQVGPGPQWGPADQAATAAFERAQGWSGPDADGICGPQTWALLVAGGGNDIPPALSAPPFPGAQYFAAGQVNAYVTELGRQLVAKGFGSHYSVGPGPAWGPADQANVADFQRSRPDLAGDADGIPGPRTWADLFS